MTLRMQLGLLAIGMGSAAPPHIVFLLSDNLGYGNVGFTRGSPSTPEVSSPIIDALASSGVRLERLYCYKFCSPSRSSFLSGRLPVHVNVNNDDQTLPGAGIPAAMTTIARKLKDGGYRTAHIGKWHAGFASSQHTPLGRGFDSSIAYLWAYNGYLHGWAEQGCPQYPGLVAYPSDANGTLPSPPASRSARCTEQSVVARHLAHVTDLWRTENGAEGPAHGVNASMNGFGYEEAFFLSEAQTVIAGHGAALAAETTAAPLFLYYAMHLLHSPLCAPPALLERFAFIENEDRRYVSAMVAYMDGVVGDVVDALKAAQLWEKTLLVWQSDNGAAIELTTGAKSAYPLRGGYYTNWEGGVRAPAFANGGFLLAALAREEAAGKRPTTGRAYDGLFHIADWCVACQHGQRRMGLPFCSAGCFVLSLTRSLSLSLTHILARSLPPSSLPLLPSPSLADSHTLKGTLRSACSRA